MDNFVDICTLYSKREELDLEFLSQVYNDIPLLESKIRSLVNNHLTDSTIRGKKILMKPNWVRHNIKSTDGVCLCTHEHFVLAVLKFVLEKSPNSIIIADAPIQGCDWNRLLSNHFLDKIKQLSIQYGIDIQIKDLRRTVLNVNQNAIQKDRVSLDDYIIFDVGKKSYLEPITSDENRFRVTKYNPDKLAITHRKGVHKYCIAKDVFDADVVITLPKIKTHQKAGLTNAMKILVGVNGDKDYLPHHRLGAKGYGGDCYPGYNILRSCSEYFLDMSNRHIGEKKSRWLSRISTALWRLSLPTQEQNLGAGWYGNDTVWRMVLDLNMIVEYGDIDGSISTKKQRDLYSLCDGIIGGQGDGPLNPTPLPLGVILFSNNAYWTDIVTGYLLSMDIDCTPLLKAVSNIISGSDCQICVNGNKVCIDSLKSYSVKAQMAPGWVNYKMNKL